MSGGWKRLPEDSIEDLVRRVKDLERRIRERENPTGMQMLGTYTRTFPTTTIATTTSTASQFVDDYPISFTTDRPMRILITGRARLDGETTVTSAAGGSLYGSISVLPDGQVDGRSEDTTFLQFSPLGGTGLSTTLTYTKSLNISYVLDIDAGPHTFNTGGLIQRTGSAGSIGLSNFRFAVTLLGSPV